MIKTHLSSFDGKTGKSTELFNLAFIDRDDAGVKDYYSLVITEHVPEIKVEIGSTGSKDVFPVIYPAGSEIKALRLSIDLPYLVATDHGLNAIDGFDFPRSIAFNDLKDLRMAVSVNDLDGPAFFLFFQGLDQPGFQPVEIHVQSSVEKYNI